MSPTESALRESVTPARQAERVIDRARLMLGAAPLDSGSAHTHAISRADLQTLTLMAEEGLRRRLKAAPVAPIGPVGKLVSIVAGDDRNRLIAQVEFADEDDLTRVGALIATSVCIEAAPPALNAANEEAQGEGSPNQDEEED